MAPLNCSRNQKRGIVPKPVLDKLCNICEYNKPQANYDIFDFFYMETENSDVDYQYIIVGENNCNFRLEKAESKVPGA